MHNSRALLRTSRSHPRHRQDGSGEIDRGELRSGLCFIFPHVPKDVILKLERRLRDAGSISASDQLEVKDYMETVEVVRAELAADETNWAERETGSKSTRGGVRRRDTSKRLFGAKQRVKPEASDTSSTAEASAKSDARPLAGREPTALSPITSVDSMDNGVAAENA